MRSFLATAIIIALFIITCNVAQREIKKEKKQAYTDGAAMAVMELQKTKKSTIYPLPCYFSWPGDIVSSSCTLWCYLKAETLIIVKDSILDRRPIKKAEIFIDPNHGGAGRLYDNINKRYLDGLK